MLTNIENRLEELFEQIEMMPPEKVEMAEKVLFRKSYFHFEKLIKGMVMIYKTFS